MTKLRKFISAVLAVAALSTTGYSVSVTPANAWGYYVPGNGYYGQQYYHHRRRQHCWYERVPRVNYYGVIIGYRQVKRCGWQ